MKKVAKDQGVQALKDIVGGERLRFHGYMTYLLYGEVYESLRAMIK